MRTPEYQSGVERTDTIYLIRTNKAPALSCRASVAALPGATGASATSDLSAPEDGRQRCAAVTGAVSAAAVSRHLPRLAYREPELPTEILVARNAQAAAQRRDLDRLRHEGDPDVQRYRAERARRSARGALVLVPVARPPEAVTTPRWLRPARREQPTKQCGHCGRTFAKKTVTSARDWARRTACSNACRNKLHGATLRARRDAGRSA